MFTIHLQREMITIVKQACPFPLVLTHGNILFVELLRVICFTKTVSVARGQGGKDTYDFAPLSYLAGAITRCLLSVGLSSQMLQA